MSLAQTIVNCVKRNDENMTKKRAALKDAECKLQELKEARAKGYQNQNEISIMTDKVNALRREVKELAAQAKAEAIKYCDEEIDRLTLLDMPNAAHLSPDADLLRSGINLSRRELTALMNKSENKNTTMHRLFTQYADANKIELPTEALASFTDHRAEIDGAERAKQAMSYVEGWLNMADGVATKNISECFGVEAD